MSVDYNKSWNYYEGMDSDTIELHIRQDTVWQRPSWPMGQWGALGGARASIHDGFGFFHEPSGTRERRPEPRTPEERALATLDLEMPVTLAEIKIRYKILAKQLHPDANGGDQAAEERLKHDQPRPITPSRTARCSETGGAVFTFGKQKDHGKRIHRRPERAQLLPDITISARQSFGIDSDMQVPAFASATSTSPTSTRPTASTATPRSRSWPASPTTGAS